MLYNNDIIKKAILEAIEFDPIFKQQLRKVLDIEQDLAEISLRLEKINNCLEEMTAQIKNG